MIRLVHTLGLLIEKGTPSVKASLHSPKRAIAFPMPGMLPRDQKGIPGNRKISSCSRPQLRAGLILPNSSALRSRYHSELRLSSFFPPNASQQSIGLQRRLVSTTPLTREPSIDSRITGLSRFINDPAKRQRFIFGLKLARIALFFLVGKIIYEEVRIELSLGPRPVDAEKVKEIKEFVVAFNREKEKGVSRKQFLSFQDKAFTYIDELRSLGELAAWRPFNTDLFLAKRGFLELSTCEDPKVQREALRYLNMLLKKSFDPTQPAAKFLWLEEDLGNILRNKSEVNDSIPVMQELATAYGLVLEKIFLFCLDGGAQISNDQKLRVRKRANQISKKLENNPAFAYQAKNAEVIAKYLPTPSQPLSQTFKGMFELAYPVSQAIEAVSGTIEGINELVEISKRHGRDITPLLTQELFSYERWEKLKGFIEKSPILYEDCEEALRRLENSWTNLKREIPFYESIFLLRPCYMMSGKDDEVIEAIAESVRIVRQRSDSDWISFYRLVEMLAEIALSNRSYDVRKTAYDQIVACMTRNTPWQVLYKIAVTLFSLKTDPLFAKSVEDALTEEQALFQSKPELRRGLRWFQNMGRQIEDIDQAILSRYSLQPDPDSKLAKQLNRWAFKAKAFIPRNDVLENLVNAFQEYRADTNQQVICGQGGVGKTTSATSYVKEFGRDYTFVYWVDAHTFEEDWDRLAEKRGIAPNLDRDQKQMLLREYLEREENEGWLLVIDQVDNKDLGTWGHLIPRKGGHVLMTARHLDAREWIAVRQTNLRCFSPLEAVHYILESKRPTYRGDNDYVTTIVNRFGCLPLALAQTRAYLERNRGVSLKSFLDLYDEERTRIFGSSGAKIGGEENESVHTTWAMNFKQLEEKHQKIAELFSFLSFLGSDEIPSCLIEKWKEMNVPEWGKLKINEAIQTLFDYVLLDVEKEGVYSIHPLICQVSRDRLNEEQKRKFVLQAVSVLWELSTSIFESDQTDKIQVFEVLRPHCEAVVEFAKEIDFNGMDCFILEDLWFLIISLGFYRLLIEQDYISSHNFFDCALELFKDYKSEELGEKVIAYTFCGMSDLLLLIAHPSYIVLKNHLVAYIQPGAMTQLSPSENEMINRLFEIFSRKISTIINGLLGPSNDFDDHDTNTVIATTSRRLLDKVYALVDKIAKNQYKVEDPLLVFEDSAAAYYMGLFAQLEKYDDDDIRYWFKVALAISELVSNPSIKQRQLIVAICRELVKVSLKLGDIKGTIDYQRKLYETIKNIYKNEAHYDVKRALTLLKSYQAMDQTQSTE